MGVNHFFGYVYLLVFLFCQAASVAHAYNCYETTCLSADCLANITTDGGAQCDGTAYGCQLLYMYSNTDGTESVMWSASCAPSSCASAAALSTDSDTVIHCCSSELCNSNLPIVQPGLNQCYAVSCSSDGCVEAAVAANKVTSCNMGEHGCSLSKVKQGNSTTIVATCSATPCQASSVALDSTEVTNECCSTDLCNSKFRGFQPVGNQCYQGVCYGENCIKTAIADNNIAGCPRDENGCAVTYIKNVTSGEIMGTASCMPLNVPCSAMAILSDDSEISIQCCTTNLCNIDLIAADPGKKCNSVKCEGENCLAKANREGKSVTCNVGSEFGCATMRTTNGTAVSEMAMCFPRKCYAGKSDSVETKCCNTDRCNMEFATTSAGVSVRTSIQFVLLFVFAYKMYEQVS